VHPADAPEPVGSPAVLSKNRVSNLPLRVVRSLFITIKEGFVMDRAKAGLTVYFGEPFWVGVFERIEDGKISVCKVTFGSIHLPQWGRSQHGDLKPGAAGASDLWQMPPAVFFCVVCPAKLDHTCRCKSGHGNRQ